MFNELECERTFIKLQDRLMDYSKAINVNPLPLDVIHMIRFDIKTLLTELKMSRDEAQEAGLKNAAKIRELRWAYLKESELLDSRFVDAYFEQRYSMMEKGG